MTKLAILSAYERNRFDVQPKFNADERSLYFSLTDDNLDLLKGFRSPTTKIGFVLQLGYFKSNAKFYPSDQFRKPDIDFVAKILGLEHENIDLIPIKKKYALIIRRKFFHY